jgi:hypothetical protein
LGGYVRNSQPTPPTIPQMKKPPLDGDGLFLPDAMAQRWLFAILKY